MKYVKCDSRIAPWRIDSDDEKRLANEADINENAKQAYAEYYHENDTEYYEKGLTMINKVIDSFRPNSTETERNRYTYDMVYSLHRFGCMFDEYFLFNYESLNTKGRESFITDKNRWDYYQQLNSLEGRSLFNDKVATYNVFKQFYKRELVCISDERDYNAFCAFREKHQSFIVKPTLGSGGRGVFIVKDKKKTDKRLFNIILEKGPVVIEELIHQAKEMEQFHPNSLNTMRIPTILLNGKVTLFHPFLRIGVGESEVDNAASGGIIANVDPETGIVTQYGITEFGKKHIVHPDSHITIPGFQIPKWEEAVSFVDKLARVIPENHYVGWDCALTESGWIMVEGNAQGQFVTQYATQTGIRKELDSILQQL